jgi:microcystin-dependent protein
VSEPFLSEIKIMSFNFPPKGWAFCNGQLLPINQNQALFSLLGTVYGGNGQTNFALPDLRGRLPSHFGAGTTLGERSGSESVTLNIQQLPTHPHLANVVNVNANVIDPTNNYFGSSSNLYQPGPPNTSLAPNTITNVGGSQPHENRQPFTVLNFCIALIGIFPSQN